MTQPLFSVIIPTYDRSDYLREAMESVLGQSVADIECIVVDDASPTARVATTDPRVRVVRRDTNGGAAAARNSGVDIARGRYLAFLDDDDRWTPNRLELALRGLERAPIAVCWSRFDDEPDAAARGRVLDGLVGDSIRDGITPHLGATALERAVWSPLDVRFSGAAEVEWWLRVTDATPVATVPELGCVVRRHAGHRHGNDAGARVQSLALMRELHADYFAAHRRADAFHLFRIGLMAMKAGDRRTARASLLHSTARSPRPRTLYQLLRAISPTIVSKR